MHDGWCGSFKLARSSGYYTLDPFAFTSVDERNEECVPSSGNIHWRSVELA
jgi:hypothetical protein